MRKRFGKALLLVVQPLARLHRIFRRRHLAAVVGLRKCCLSRASAPYDACGGNRIWFSCIGYGPWFRTGGAGHAGLRHRFSVHPLFQYLLAVCMLLGAVEGIEPDYPEYRIGAAEANESLALTVCILHSCAIIPYLGCCRGLRGFWFPLSS